MIRGRVLSLARWPVKSMAGEVVPAARVDGRGMGGDRTHAVWEEGRNGWRPLTARQAPRLLAWRATYPDARDAALDPAAPPLCEVVSPAGDAYRWDDPALEAALAEDLGRRPLRLVRDELGQQDLDRSLLVTVHGTCEAIGNALGRGLDLRRLRTNVHLALDAEPYAEERFEGGVLRIGELRLQLLHACGRCVIPTRDPETQQRWPELLRWLTREHGGLLGINARPLNAATIEVGTRVELEPPAQ